MYIKKQIVDDKLNYLVMTLFVILPAIVGYISGDFLVGGTLVMTGLFSSYLASIGKRAGFVFGFINAILIAYVAYKNNLFGAVIVNIFVFIPLEIYGFFSWSSNLDSKKDVKAKKFTAQKALIVVTACILGSVLFGTFLSLIPGQQLAFIDSTINCLDICALILLNLRYRESWILWITSSVLSVIVWAIALLNGGENTFMRLIATISFLAINIYGATNWYIKTKAKRSKDN